MRRTASAAFRFLLRRGGAKLSRSVYNPLVRAELAWRHHFASLTGSGEGMIDLNRQLTLSYGWHRSGWLYALSGLKSLHNPHGVFFDSFLERTFVYQPGGARPHLRPWIGVLHVPPQAPDWFLPEQANDAVIRSPAFQDSLPYCRGLYTLSDYHRRSLEEKVPVPVNSLFLATDIPGRQWSRSAFMANPDRKIVQIGWWLRKLHAIYRLQIHGYRKCCLNIAHVPRLEGIRARERQLLRAQGQYDDTMQASVSEIGFLGNRDYDRLLSENIVFVELYDASANNLVVECLARSTPILVNPLPAVREYLGEDYPLYFRSLNEAAAKAEDLDLVDRAHRYLAGHPNRIRLHRDHFRLTLQDSSIYRGLCRER